MDEIEQSLVGFLCSDPSVLELIQTKPEPPRAYPNTLPQGINAALPHIVYWLADRTEYDSHSGPSGLPNAHIVLECRQQASSPKQARLLAKRIRECKGADPAGSALHGYRGYWPYGYFVHKCWVTDTSYEYIRPAKAGELGIHIVAVEVRIWWNAK